MGLFSSIRAAKRMSEHSSYEYRNYGYSIKSTKSPFEKVLDDKKEAYPNSWKYFINRISKGILEASIASKTGKINLTEKQKQILHNLVNKYWDKYKKRLIIPGKKNMNYFYEIEQLIPDLELFKILWSRKGTWPTINSICTLKSPVSGSQWVNGHFVEEFYIPLPILYNQLLLSKSNTKAKLIINNKLSTVKTTKLEKVLITPKFLPKEIQKKPWLLSKSYWAYLPPLKLSKKFKVIKSNGQSSEESIYKFWSLKKNKLL